MAQGLETPSSGIPPVRCAVGPRGRGRKCRTARGRRSAARRAKLWARPLAMRAVYWMPGQVCPLAMRAV